MPRGAWASAASAAGTPAQQAHGSVVLIDEVNRTGAAAGGQQGLLFTPQASPGYQQDSAAAVLAAGARGLAHNGSSMSSRHGLRASIDSLSSPSFKEAAAAVTYQNNAYNSFTVGRHEAGWNGNPLDADEVVSSLAADAAASRQSTDFYDDDAPADSASAHPGDSMTAAAAAALRASGLSGHGMGDSAVFENSLFDGSSDDEGDAMLAMSARSRGQLTPLMGTPRISVASSHMLQCSHSQSNLGFAAVAAADVDGAAEVAAAVAVTASMTTPLSVYKNAAFEEEEGQRRTSSSSSATARDRVSSPVPALSLQKVQAAAAAADSTSDVPEILYSRQRGDSSTAYRPAEQPGPASYAQSAATGLELGPSGAADELVESTSRSWAASPIQVAAASAAARGEEDVDGQQEQQQQRRQWQQPVVPVFLGNLNACSSDEGGSSGYSGRSSSDGDILEYHYTAAAAATDTAADTGTGTAGAGAGSSVDPNAGLLESLLTSEDSNAERPGSPDTECEQQPYQWQHQGHSDQQQHQQPDEQRQQEPDLAGSSWMYSEADAEEDLDFSDEDDELPVMRIRGGGCCEPADSDDDESYSNCCREDYDEADDHVSHFEVAWPSASELVVSTDGHQEQLQQQWHQQRHMVEHHWEATNSQSGFVLRLRGGAGYEDESGVHSSRQQEGVDAAVGIGSSSSDSAAVVSPSSKGGVGAAGRRPGRLLGNPAAARVAGLSPVDTPPQHQPKLGLVQAHLSHGDNSDSGSGSANGSGSNIGWKIAAAEQTPLSPAASPQPCGPGLNDSASSSNHYSTAVPAAVDPQPGEPLQLFSSGSDISESDDEQECFTASSGGGDDEVASRVKWAQGAPPAGWQLQGGSYRVAVHTSGKPGSGTRTRVSSTVVLIHTMYKGLTVP